MKLSEIAERLECRLEGDGDVEIRRVAGIERAGPGDLTFLVHQKYASKFAKTRASAIIVGLDVLSRAAPAALLRTAQEALVNAAKYAGDSPISVYAEVEPEQVTVFVRDRGPGFDVEAVPEDRMGLRQSVVGRMQRHGGRVFAVVGRFLDRLAADRLNDPERSFRGVG